MTHLLYILTIGVKGSKFAPCERGIPTEVLRPTNYNSASLCLAFFIYKKYNKYERCVCYIMQIKTYYDFKSQFFDWLDNILINGVQLR